MKKSHIAANVLVAVLITVVFWGIPDEFVWLTRFILVSTIFGIVGLLIYIAARFRDRASD